MCVCVCLNNYLIYRLSVCVCVQVCNISLTNQLLPSMLKDGLLDSSNYPPSHPLHSKEHTAKLGCVKDESGGGAPFAEWVLLRPKCYSMRTRDAKEHKRAKGVQRSVVSNELTHADYVNIFNQTAPTPTKDVTVRRFHSRAHQVTTIAQRKRALSIFDDKRVWLSENDSRAYGHYSLIKRCK